MFNRILVPLDGSHLAEAVLPSVAFLSKKLGSTIILIHVIERNAPRSVHGDRHLTNTQEAEEYLTFIVKTYFSPQTTIECHVHTEEVENVANSIVSHAGEFDSGLIVMCAHGNQGVHDWVVGSLPQQVINQGKTPVLLMHPDECQEILDIKQILVALDGISEHETGLPIVARLAQALSASLRLLQVVPTLTTLKAEQSASGMLLPGATTALLDMAETNAEQHLEEHAAEWRAAGLTVSTKVARGDPAPKVVEASKTADLIVLGTHGKAGIKAFWAGSVASKIIAHTHLPILLIPVNVVVP